MTQRVVDEAWASGECDLIFTFPRSRTMYRILANSVTPAFHVVGHDGGINIADGRREYHLVAMSFEPSKRLERVSPSNAIPPFARNEVLAPLGFEPAPGIYPPC